MLILTGSNFTRIITKPDPTTPGGSIVVVTEKGQEIAQAAARWWNLGKIMAELSSKYIKQ